MKNTKRQAFTIVELVIVIAVIAILSAVLIPTFGAIIRDANIAADQTAASALTTELHVYLKGETIDSEEELMAALDGAKISEKLVPKALAYGYHFWFDMATQMIISADNEDIKSRGQDAGEGASVSSGAALMSAVLVAETNETATGVRDIYSNGYLIIDHNLNDLFGNFDEITSENYAQYFTNLQEGNLPDHLEDYASIASVALENLKNTVVVNANGIFFYAGEGADASKAIYYFANGLKVVSATHYSYSGSGDVADATDLPAPAGEIKLPASVSVVEKNALNFSGAATLVMPTTDVEKAASVLAPASTNATVKIGDGTYAVTTTTECAETGHEDKTCDILLNKADNSIAAHLLLKLPFENFTIGYTEKENFVKFNGDTLYISYLENGNVSFVAKDAASDATSTYVESWTTDNDAITFSPEGKLVFDGDAIISGSHKATITARANNMYGNPVTATLNVEVKIPESASVKVAGIDFPLGHGNQTLTYFVTPQNKNITPSINVTHWKSETGDTLYDLRNGNGDLTIKDANGADCTDVTLGEKTTSFTVSLDGYLETKFTVSVVNLEASPFKPTYRHSYNNFTTQQAGDKSAYYVGSENLIKLSDLFVFQNGKAFTDVGEATINVYGWADETGLSSVDELNNYYLNEDSNYLTVTYSHRTVSSADQWNAATIKFNPSADYDRTNVNLKLVVEVAPKNDYPTYAYITVVDGAINVSTIDDLAKTHTTDVVLHKDVVATSEHKIVLGANTLYGNGCVISAPGYKSTAADNVLTDALISVNGGTIDNIYIDGPVYPSLDYDNNNNKYYVSGIITAGESHITNSYVSGFRQPVKANGTVTHIENTTLRGGNFANLVLASGILNVTDVTTVQDVDGMAPTVDNTNYNKGGVIGVGIYIEGTAIRERQIGGVNLYGYLDQYNWIKKGTQSTLNMPKLGDLDIGALVGCIFDGVKMDLRVASVHAEMGSLKQHLHKGSNATSGYDQYVSAGIVYAELTQESETLTISRDFVKDYRTKEKNVPKRTFQLLDIPFDGTGVDLRITKITAKTYLGTYGRFVAWGGTDGRDWKVDDIQIDWRNRVASRTVSCSNENADYVVSNETAIDGYTGKILPITYNGYYDTNGIYKDFYN